MTVRLLAVDGGQSGIKVRLVHNGERTEEKFPGVQTDEAVLPQLARVVKRVIAQNSVPINTVTVGTTGLVKAEHDARKLFELINSEQLHHVALAHDSVSSYLGALGDRHGVVVAAGTGVVTLAVGAKQVARIDGWGHIMGDVGSGYWIGQQALIAAMRHYDGRGPHTKLTHAVKDRWSDLSEAYIELQALEDRVATVASFAAHVATLADTDQIAAQICQRAGEELADSAATAIRRVDLAGSDEIPVAAIGGVFEGEHVRRTFTEKLCELLSAAQVQPQGGNGLDGVQRLAELAPEHALQELISHHQH